MPRNKNASSPPGLVVESAETSEFSRLSSELARLSIVGLFCIVSAVIFHQARFILAPVCAGLLVGFACGPLAQRLEKHGVFPALSSAAIVLSMLVLLAAILGGLAVPLETWSRRVPEIGSKIAAEWDRIKEPIEKLQAVEQQVTEAAQGKQQPMKVTVMPAGFVTGLVSTAPEAIARLLLFLGTLYFFLAARSRMKRSLLALCPSDGLRLRIARIARDVEDYLSRYVATITMVNIGLGVVVTLATYAFGLPSPYLWGAMAAVLNFAPYIGPAVMAAILVGVGLTVFDTVALATLPALVYIGLNVLEGQFLTPALLGRTLTLNPLLVFLSLAFWLWLWGPLGAFVAVPLLIIATMTLHHLGTRSPAVKRAGKPRNADPIPRPVSH